MLFDSHAASFCVKQLAPTQQPEAHGSSALDKPDKQAVFRSEEDSEYQ